MSQQGLQASIEKMVAAGVGQAAIDSFSRQYHKVETGQTGLIAEESIEPMFEVAKFDAKAPIDEAEAHEVMSHFVMIRPNGGLGTSMGLEGPKSLLPVRDGRTFLDLIVAQIMAARRRWDVDLPLVLMNSFATQAPADAALSQYEGLGVGRLPLSFLQSKEPKLLAADLTPVTWPAEPSLEWCPPGHGDIYGAMFDSGLLDALIDAGKWFAQVGNVDNLGCSPSAGLAVWFAASGAPYMVEVCRRTANDKKGGHLAIRRSDGRLILRDTAQTPPSEMHYFTDPNRHPYFHTNNLWWDLRAVRRQLNAGALDLPLILNSKTADPTDASTPAVVQIETAMGAAVEAFAGAKAIEVPRDRFIPVKKTNELLLLRSDVYEITGDAELHSQVPAVPRIDLATPYQFIDGFDRRIPSAPSLVQASSLTVQGDWTFGTGVRVVGAVTLPDVGEPRRIPDGTVLTSEFE